MIRVNRPAWLVLLDFCCFYFFLLRRLSTYNRFAISRIELDCGNGKHGILRGDLNEVALRGGILSFSWYYVIRNVEKVFSQEAVECCKPKIPKIRGYFRIHQFKVIY